MSKEAIELARELAEQEKHRALKAKEKAERTKAESLQAEKESADALAASKRLGEFQARAAEGLCPRCFIRDGTEVHLKPLDSPTENDLFHCPACGQELDVSP